MENYNIDHEMINAILSTLTTWALLVFLSCRLAVYGKKEANLPYWKSVTMIIAGNIWAQFAYTVWQPKSTTLKVVKGLSVAALLIPTAIMWVALVGFMTGYSTGWLS